MFWCIGVVYPSKATAIFDGEGHWLGEVEVPIGFAISEIGLDYILGTRRDEFDVPYVEMYSLV